MIIILLIGAYIIWYTFAPSKKERERKERAEAARIRAEVKWQKEQSQALLRKQREMEREQAKQRAEQERQRKEQERLAKEQEKQAAQLAKHEEQIAKMQFQLDTATEDIENLLARVDEQQRYAEYLEEQRNKCAEGSAEYFKWQKKLSVVDDKIYRLNKQRSKAMFLQEQAKARLSA